MHVGGSTHSQQHAHSRSNARGRSLKRRRPLTYDQADRHRVELLEAESQQLEADIASHKTELQLLSLAQGLCGAELQRGTAPLVPHSFEGRLAQWKRTWRTCRPARVDHDHAQNQIEFGAKLTGWKRKWRAQRAPPADFIGAVGRMRHRWRERVLRLHGPLHLQVVTGGAKAAALRVKKVVPKQRKPEDPNYHAVRVLTIKQPWASAILSGVKKVENRSWSIKLPCEGTGRWIAVHASKAPAPQSHFLVNVLKKVWGSGMPAEFQNMAILGFAHISRVVPVEQVERDPQAFGPLCWIIDQTVSLASPYECLGQLGLWTLPSVLDPHAYRLKASTLPQLPSCAAAALQEEAASRAVATKLDIQAQTSQTPTAEGSVHRGRSRDASSRATATTYGDDQPTAGNQQPSSDPQGAISAMVYSCRQISLNKILITTRPKVPDQSS